MRLWALLALCACSAVMCVPSSGRNKRQGQQQQVLDIPLDELAYTHQGEGPKPMHYEGENVQIKRVFPN